MTRYDPRSWSDRFLGLCFGLLLAALAMHWAVRLVLDIWVQLVLIASAVLACAIAIAAWRSRSRW